MARTETFDLVIVFDPDHYHIIENVLDYHISSERDLIFFETENYRGFVNKDKVSVVCRAEDYFNGKEYKKFL